MYKFTTILQNNGTFSIVDIRLNIMQVTVTAVPRRFSLMSIINMIIINMQNYFVVNTIKKNNTKDFKKYMKKISYNLILQGTFFFLSFTPHTHNIF